MSLRHKLAAAAGVAAIATLGGVGAAHLTAPPPAPAVCHAAYDRPDPYCTPGAIDPRVTQANIQQTICRPGGYSASVRPPTTVTDQIKRERMKAYGLTGKMSEYELDHLVPISLGGSPDDVRNLWPEHWAAPNGAHEKDTLELHLFHEVCAGRTPLTDAQRCIALDWIACRQRMGLK